jgi:hypothetical protein
MFDTERLREFGAAWHRGAEVRVRSETVHLPNRLGRAGAYSGDKLGSVANDAVANSLAAMFGGFRVVQATSRQLVPPNAFVVEVGEVRVIGGVRPQNYDVAYRPDGVRFAFDSKTLNDTDSLGKNYQNMINDLGTEATTAHTRFPYAVVAFMFFVPRPCITEASPIIRRGVIGNLERLVGRADVNGPVHKAEAISLVVWDPDTGLIDNTVINHASPLYIDNFSQMISEAYFSRYQGLDPHNDSPIPREFTVTPPTNTVTQRNRQIRSPRSRNIPPSQTVLIDDTLDSEAQFNEQAALGDAFSEDDATEHDE